MRNRLYLAAPLVVVLTVTTPAWADDEAPPAAAASEAIAPRFQISGAVGLDRYGRSDGHFGIYDTSTSSSPTMLCWCAQLMGELQLGSGVWLGLALRTGTLAETPIQDEVRVDGHYFGAELGLAVRPSVLALRLAAGTAYMDAHWVYIGGDPDYAGGVTSWGLVIRPELALELGPSRGWSFALAAGFARTFLVDADNPFDELHLSIGLGNRF